MFNVVAHIWFGFCFDEHFVDYFDYSDVVDCVHDCCGVNCDNEWCWGRVNIDGCSVVFDD